MKKPLWVLGLLVAACFFLSPLLPLDPMEIDPSAVYYPPSFYHPLGTDDLGRDIFARVLYGGRISLAVALFSTIACVLLGGAIGLSAGFFGGAVDVVLSRLTEAVIAVPKLPLMMLIAAIPLPGFGIFGQAMKLVGVIVLFGWTGTARIARASALALRETDYVNASRALGASRFYILRKHILPGALPGLLVAAAVEVGELVVYESALSFLGLGIQPPAPSWGAMLANGLTHVYRAPLLVVVPGLLTFLTVAAANRLADDLRDVLDPRSFTAER
jgi:peptide/nickel transport system permease protein